MLENENQEAELQNFIMEITKLKESHPSLFAVENVGELQAEEGKVWEEFKMLFKQVEEKLFKSEIPAEDVLAELKAKAEDLAKVIRKNIAGIKNKNRLEFLAWMNNRLGILIGNLDYLKSDGEEEGVFQEVKDTLSREKNKLLF